MTSRALAATLSTGLLLLATGVFAEPLAETLQPDPSLGPDQVVRIQLEALRRNDLDDRGIAVAFRFASPNNKRSTGPLPRFASMIKQGPYALMLNFKDAIYAPVKMYNRQASQRVTLVKPGQRPVTYIFYLSRQDADGPLKECWMTDAVNIIPFKGEPA